MNSLQDLMALKCSDSKKREIAEMLGVWNSAESDSTLRLDPEIRFMSTRGSHLRRNRLRRIAKSFGLTVRV